jgi:hypothetical protein
MDQFLNSMVGRAICISVIPLLALVVISISAWIDSKRQ